jgi:hydrogenase-4 component F
VLLLLLAVIFVGMCAIVLRMVQDGGEGLSSRLPTSTEPCPGPESAWLVGPPMALAAIGLALGLCLPPPLVRLLQEAAALLGGGQ